MRVTCLVLALSFIAAGCGSGSGGSTSAGESPAAGSPPPDAPPPTVPPPAPPALSALITGVTFNTKSHRRAAQGSDNWPATWSNDGNMYAVWGDGGGFNGTDSGSRVSFGVARIEGDGRSYAGKNRFGGQNGECRSTITGKGHGAPISIGGVLYVWITPGANERGYDSFTLHRSRDRGCTWTRRDVSFVRTRDAYVYTVATEVTDTSTLRIVQRPGRVMLVRVPVTAIEDRGAYEFYAGLDATGQPLWSTDPADRLAIYEDLDGVGPFPQVTLVPGLDRMVYTNQHGSGSGNTATQSLLTLAESPNPWGPWQVFYQAHFFPQIERTVFQWNFAPKWFRNGGRDFTLIFSGTGSNDSWNTIDGTFTTQ